MVNSGPFLLCSGVKFHTPLMCNILSWVVTVPEALPGDARLEPVSEKEWPRNQGKVKSTDPNEWADGWRGLALENQPVPMPLERLELTKVNILSDNTESDHNFNVSIISFSKEHQIMTSVIIL